MKEEKYVHRIPPCAKYDIAGMESWLEDMSREGLYLDRDGVFFGFASFVRGEPEQLRYRLEATDTNGGLFSPTHDPTQDVIDLHRQMGWEYRGRWGQFHIYASDDPDAPELHTDPRVQALTIQSLTKFQRTELWGIFWYTVMLYCFHGSMLFSLTALWDWKKTLLLLVFLLSFPVLKLAGLIRMLRLKRQLKLGIPMTHRGDYRKTKAAVYTGRLARWLTGIYLAFSLLQIGGLQVTEENAVKLEDWTEPLPFATVQTLFPEAEVTPGGYFISNSVIDWSNGITPKNLDYTEWSDIVLPDGTDTYGYIRVWYFEARYDWFARCLARELAVQNAGTLFDRIIEDSVAPEPLAGVDADYAVSYFHYNPGIVLCQGKQVLLVRYSGAIGTVYTPEALAQVYINSIS